MKKLLFIVAFCFVYIGSAFSQMSFTRPFDNTISLGIKGGVNTPRMYYHENPVLQRLPQTIVFAPMLGIFLDLPITNAVCFTPEVMFVQRGTDMKYVHINSGAKVHYSISTSYVDLRVPLELNWKVKPYFQPFFTIGVEAGMCLFGKIQIDRLNPIAFSETLTVDSANMALIHVGAFAGVGIRSKVNIGYQDVLLKFTVSAHQGFLDSYSPYEKNGLAQATNVNAYKITGYRLPQGIEVAFGIAIPLKPRLKDACASFGNDRYRRYRNR